MAVLPTKTFNLELTISVPGLISSSPSLPSGDDQRVFMVRDLDINKVPSGREEYEWIIASMEDEEEEESFINGILPPARKKLRLTKQQSSLLEESFRQNQTLNPKQKEALALKLKLRPRQVEVWFQNRRARSKSKQTKMEFQFMKRWFESLTEQNRRLQREVEELRAMKVAPPQSLISPRSCEPFPASSTLTMCPRCERVTTTTTSLDKGSPPK